jgi:hypothetical protein
VNLEAFLAVAGDAADPGIPENAGIESRRFFGLVVEPQAGRDLLGDLHREAPVFCQR